jgi:hypothetical protein
MCYSLAIENYHIRDVVEAFKCLQNSGAFSKAQETRDIWEGNPFSKTGFFYDSHGRVFQQDNRCEKEVTSFGIGYIRSRNGADLSGRIIMKDESSLEFSLDADSFFIGDIPAVEVLDLHGRRKTRFEQNVIPGLETVS